MLAQRSAAQVRSAPVCSMLVTCNGTGRGIRLAFFTQPAESCSWLRKRTHAEAHWSRSGGDPPGLMPRAAPLKYQSMDSFSLCRNGSGAPQLLVSHPDAAALASLSARLSACGAVHVAVQAAAQHPAALVQAARAAGVESLRDFVFLTSLVRPTTVKWLLRCRSPCACQCGKARRCQLPLVSECTSPPRFDAFF